MAPEKKTVELMDLFWTHAGIYPGEHDISPYDFKKRVESACRAGFTGIGIWHADLEHTLQKYSLKELKTILDDHGMKHIELEFLTNWFIDGPKRKESNRVKHILFEAAQVLDARHIKVGDFYRTPCPMFKLVETFAQLCDEAKEYGVRIGFEFMPSSVINNLPDSLTLVTEAGAGNGGIILDIAHVMHQNIGQTELNEIPLNYLISLELNDGTFPGSPLHDPTIERRFCGDGDFDIKGFIAWGREKGYQEPWAVEVFSKELLNVPLDTINEQAYKTTIAQFAEPG